MKYYSGVLVLVGFSGFVADFLIPGVSGYDLGASCDYDEDCIAEHSFCQMQRTCQCKRGFQPANDGSTCLASVAAACRTKYDCVSLPHSDCLQDMCLCEPDFVPDPAGKQCLPRVKDIKGSCLQDTQCQESFGDQSRCIGGRCECNMRFHFLNGRCFQTKDLNEFCSNSSECFIGPEYTTTIECRDQRCQCVRGYYGNEYRKCTRSFGFKTTSNVDVIVTISIFIFLFNSDM
ncbi:multiple epidermal growth factor-like domains protein 6 [Macrosteles quadrilineatus]|uniref:multiple epidermal growth factor-like domains protein 6 n=1 Tax=Macrosteles quadrilineatus TaxID=74068 RepID=UPI0023E2D00B|nr:multiple epidermal growth factor-like domains protein 6 [Macrosteles quadrilineatus]